MVKFVGVSQNYGKFQALNNINFDIKEGSLLALLGPNGAGKSTTMSIMTGLRPPIEGEVFINGINIFEEPEKAKSFIGYLPEIPPLYPELTVIEYLVFVAKLYGMNDKEALIQAENSLELLKISERKNALIKNLSKGLKQRVGIAQSILHNPKLLVLDEPTVGLEPSQLIEFRHLISSLAREHNMTVVISTHIIAEASELCDEVIILNEGKKIFEGSKDVLLTYKNKNFQYKLVVRENSQQLIEKLTSLDGITNITQKHQFLEIESKKEIAENISEIVVLGKYGLQEISPMKNNLEAVFLELTDKKEVI